jgi:hypothetical protein
MLSNELSNNELTELLNSEIFRRPGGHDTELFKTVEGEMMR